MAPTVVLLRHGEAFHNLKDKNLKPLELLDPELTEAGKAQCELTARSIVTAGSLYWDIDLIVTSPLTRCLQSTAIIFRLEIERRKVPVVVRPEWQEVTSGPNDTPSTLISLKDSFPDFDWSAIEEQETDDWRCNQGLFARDLDAINERADAAKLWLKSRQEKVIAVVSHNTFYRMGVCNLSFGNSDYKIFNFKEDAFEMSESDSEDSNIAEYLELVESAATRDKNGARRLSSERFFAWKGKRAKGMDVRKDGEGTSRKVVKAGSVAQKGSAAERAFAEWANMNNDDENDGDSEEQANA